VLYIAQSSFFAFVLIQDGQNIGGTMSTQNKAIYRYSDLAAMGYGCRTTIWNLVKEGKFPQPIDAGGRSAWIPEELNEWVSTRPRIQYGNVATI